MLVATCPSYLQPASGVHGIGRLGSENTQEEPSWRLVAKMSLGCLDCILAREIRSKTPTCQMVDLNACFSQLYEVVVRWSSTVVATEVSTIWLLSVVERARELFADGLTLHQAGYGGLPVMAGGLEFHTFSVGFAHHSWPLRGCSRVGSLESFPGCGSTGDCEQPVGSLRVWRMGQCWSQIAGVYFFKIYINIFYISNMIY